MDHTALPVIITFNAHPQLKLAVPVFNFRPQSITAYIAVSYIIFSRSLIWEKLDFAYEGLGKRRNIETCLLGCWLNSK